MRRLIHPLLWLGLMPAWAVSGGHGGGPPGPQGGGPRPTPDNPIPGRPARYDIGDYSAWWKLSRDEYLLQLKPLPADDPLAKYAYKGAPPDTLKALLSLVGFEGHFATLVKEIGLRRLKRFPKVEDALINVLHDPKELPPERAWAAYALGDLHMLKAVPALKAAMKETDLEIRGFSARALALMGDEDAVVSVLPLLKDPTENTDLRTLVALCLAGYDFPKVRDALVQVSREPGLDAIPVRRAALMALGLKPRPEDLALLKEAAEDKTPWIRCAALLGLGFAGQETDSIRRLLSLKAKEPEAVVRCYAALALGLAKPKGVESELLEVLDKDPDFQVKGCATLALGRLQSPSAVGPLGKALHAKSYTYVSHYAAVGLGLTRLKEALPRLLEGVGTKDRELINASITGLTLLELPEAIPHLTRALENRQYPDIREFALVGLGRLRHPGSYARLVAGLADSSPPARHAAAIALAVYGDPEACPDLEKLLKDEKDEMARQGAALAFDILTNDPERALMLGDKLKGDPRNKSPRTVGLLEVQRALNALLPKDYKLPIRP